MTEILYGVSKKDQKIISIIDIPDDLGGLKCDCACASCGRDLQACSLHGKVRRYFRHHTDTRDGAIGGVTVGCDVFTANETALHKMAKEIIEEEKTVFVPEKTISLQEANVTDLPPDMERNIPPFELQNATTVTGQSVELEKRLNGFTPDAVIKTVDRELLIEIFVCHKVDKEKEEKVQEYGSDMLQIDLSDYSDSPICRDEVRKIIVAGEKLKKWVYYPLEENDLNQAREYYEKLDVVKQYRQLCAKESRKQEKEKADRARRNDKIKRLLEPANYAAELRRLRNDSAFQKTYAKWHQSHWFDFGNHFQEHKTVPFFVDIPIKGEMVFQCDRRVWQSILFNRYVYGRIQNSAAIPPVDKIFNVLQEYYGIKIDYDLIFKLQDPKSEDKFVWLRVSVIYKYLEHLETIGFVTPEDRLGLRYVIANKTIAPPKKDTADYLLAALARADRLSPDIDRLIDIDRLKEEHFWEEKIPRIIDENNSDYAMGKDLKTLKEINKNHFEKHTPLSNRSSERCCQQPYPEAKIGMKVYHENYGVLEITEVEPREDKTIIHFIDSNKEVTSKNWNILWDCNKIKIIK